MKQCRSILVLSKEGICEMACRKCLLRLQCWYYWWREFKKCAIEMASGGMIYVRSCVMIRSGIQGILLLYYINDMRCCSVGVNLLQIFMKYVAEMASGGMICVSVFTKIGTSVQIWKDTHTHTHTHTHTPKWSHKPAFIFRNEEHRLKKACVRVRVGVRARGRE
jgi:hypothetical protein